MSSLTGECFLSQYRGRFPDDTVPKVIVDHSLPLIIACEEIENDLRRVLGLLQLQTKDFLSRFGRLSAAVTTG